MFSPEKTPPETPKPEPDDTMTGEDIAIIEIARDQLAAEEKQRKESGDRQE